MAYSVQRDMSYVKACRIKKLRIEKAEINVQDSGLDYLKQIRYATFICLKYGENSLQYKKALNSVKKALGKFMNALEFCYSAINLDIKELMD